VSVEPGRTQLRAEVERVSYRNEDNGWTVLKVRNCDDNLSVTVTGHFAAVHAGEQFELFGAWGKHPQYGQQFKAERIVPIRPQTSTAIERYLASGLIKGIGPKTASRIVAHFRETTLDVLDADPRRLLEVPGVGRSKADTIIASWKEQRGAADVMLFLSTHGISPLYAARIHKIYGADAVKIVASDPYRLAVDIHGIGFLSADRIARSVGIAADSAERVRAAVLYLLGQGEERGHTFVTSAQLMRMLEETLQLDQTVVATRGAAALAFLEELGAVITEVVELDGEKVRAHYRPELLACELNVAARVNELLGKPLAIDEARLSAWLERYREASGTELTEEQLRAVGDAARHRVFVLTGGPGVGKTTTANTIIRLLKAMGRGVALAAPTGRAAQRLTEVAATPAKTIHRLLEWAPQIGGFARDEDNPLAFDAIIVDEASMLDVRLADALLRAVPPHAQIVFIGDVDQLPSVGPGNVLRDLMQSGIVPFARLTQIFRQAASSRIVRTAHAINAGEAPPLDEDGGDCRFVEVPANDDIKAEIEALVTGRLRREFGLDPIAELQILTPMNRGDLGTQTLNEELQALLNPPREGVAEFRRGGIVLRVGDKVIQVANDYDLGVFNGDIGQVVAAGVDAGRVVVAFPDGRNVAYDDEAIVDLRLAYAITIHKAQGSEFPAVIIPCSMQHYVMLQRNLMYTALTRARRLAIFVGAKKALAYAVHNVSGTARQTDLVAKLRRAAGAA
jgi:exodeoxyribonuclease V alpha subunit